MVAKHNHKYLSLINVLLARSGSQSLQALTPEKRYSRTEVDFCRVTQAIGFLPDRIWIQSGFNSFKLSSGRTTVQH